MNEKYSNLPPATAEAWRPPLREHIYAEIDRLDPELLNSPEAKRIVEVGAQFIERVTQDYGTPENPKWYVGSLDQTIMTYHNGESPISAGHTSVGPGAGVPRSGLVIARAINRQAGREVLPVVSRARIFTAAAAHDAVQLCGRSITYEQAGRIGGDEMLSAQAVYDALELAGVESYTCRRTATNVLATMFDPSTQAQAIRYSGSYEEMLEQEVTACADLFTLLHPKCVRGILAWRMEEIGLLSHNRILQQQMAIPGVTQQDLTDAEKMAQFIDQVPALWAAVKPKLQTETQFIKGFVFSDKAIRQVCGAGMDELFPGARARNIARAEAMAQAVSRGASFYDCWQRESKAL